MDAQHRVLVVDDDPYIREMVSELLGLLGYCVSSACDGETGLETLAMLGKIGANPELILLDHQMPHGDAVGFIFGLNERGCIIPFVLMSGDHQEGKRMASYLGAVGFLAKPFSVTELLECLECQFVRAC